MSSANARLDRVATGPLLRARPWDVIGAALGAPMVLSGFLDWFGTAGDSGGGVPGFFSGTGAAGIALALTASALTVHQILEGRAHVASAPPVAVLLAGAACIVVLGGMIAKPDNATLQVGSVAALLTAISQVIVLIVGWLQGSEKSVKAAAVRALNAQQEAADAAALAAAPRTALPSSGGYPQNQYGQSGPPPFHPPPPYGQPGQSPYPQAPYPQVSRQPGQPPR